MISMHANLAADRLQHAVVEELEEDETRARVERELGRRLVLLVVHAAATPLLGGAVHAQVVVYLHKYHVNLRKIKII